MGLPESSKIPLAIVAGAAVATLVSAALSHFRRHLSVSRCVSGDQNATTRSDTGDQSAVTRYSTADQVARFAAQKRDGVAQVVNVDSVFNGSSFRGQRVLITGANRGLGLAIANELSRLGAQVIAAVRKASPELRELRVQIVEGVDVTSEDAIEQKLIPAVKNQMFDVLINNAGYFYEPKETILKPNFPEEIKMIDICAVGPLRVSSALLRHNLMKKGSKIAMITSQGGSIEWRTTQNPDGGDYGHHMSKAAANMAGRLLAQELRSKNICVSNLHPGFNRTDMTKKYEKIWDIEGAVDVSIGAKRVLLEIQKMSMDRTGNFVNCEDGLDIPW